MEATDDRPLVPNVMVQVTEPSSLVSFLKKLMNLPARGVTTLIGSVTIFFTLGSFFTYGNLTTYSTSYIRNSSSPRDLSYDEAFWVNPTIACSMGLTMFLGGALGKWAGNMKVPILLGSIVMSVANVISFWTIKESFWMLLLSYGVLQGIGVGLAYPTPLRICCEWFPNDKGLINGIILTGIGVGTAIFDLVITEYLNPNNLLPSVEDKGGSYFRNETILEKVPGVFIILGATFFVMQILSLLIIFEKEKSWGLLSCIFKSSNSSPADNINEGVETPDSLQNNIQKKIPPETDMRQNFTPKEMIVTRSFWKLSLIYFCNGVGVGYIAGFWKEFGQSCSFDDQFLAVIGSISSVVNGVGRIFWGKVADKVHFRTAMICVTSSNVALYLSFYVAIVGGKFVYGLYVVLLFFGVAATPPLLTTVCARTFGLEYMAENFGLLFIAIIPQSLFNALISKPLGTLSWYGQFWIIGGLYCISFVMAFLYPTHTAEGFKI